MFQEQIVRHERRIYQSCGASIQFRLAFYPDDRFLPVLGAFQDKALPIVETGILQACQNGQLKPWLASHVKTINIVQTHEDPAPLSFDSSHGLLKIQTNWLATEPVVTPSQIAQHLSGEWTSDQNK